jgi:deoxyribose-phosphate aldolase
MRIIIGHGRNGVGGGEAELLTLSSRGNRVHPDHATAKKVLVNARNWTAVEFQKTMATRSREQTMIAVTDEEIGLLVACIDYAEALTITATAGDVQAACAVGKRFGFRAVVAFPQHLGIIVDALAGTRVRAQIPVGFPCGGQTTRIKCVEAEEGLKRGATDLDMVMNISAFKAGDYRRVADDIGEVLATAGPFEVPIKVIIETGVLTEEEKVTAVKLVADTGAMFVKTCTGFGPGRATVHDIVLIRQTAGNRLRIKASGGVAFLEDGIALMRAGADVVAMRKALVDQLETIGFERR